MTHFPSIPGATLSEIIHHKVLKGPQIVLPLSSPLSSSSLHISMPFPTYKSLTAVLPNAHLQTLKGTSQRRLKDVF